MSIPLDTLIKSLELPAKVALLTGATMFTLAPGVHRARRGAAVRRAHRRARASSSAAAPRSPCCPTPRCSPPPGARRPRTRSAAPRRGGDRAGDPRRARADHQPAPASGAGAQRRRPQRRAIAPVVTTGGLALMASGVANGLDAAGARQGWADVLEQLALAAVPFGFLAGLLRSRIAQAGAMSSLMARLGRRPGPRRGARRAGGGARGSVAPARLLAAGRRALRGRRRPARWRGWTVGILGGEVEL